MPLVRVIRLNGPGVRRRILLGYRLPSDGPFEGPTLVQPSRRLMCQKSGRNVAKHPAVIASPCSVSDQIAMSTVAPRRRV